MTGFSVNYDQASDGNLISPGVYETIIREPHLDEYKGVPYLSIPLVIRNDIPQKHKNNYIWYSMRLKKNPEPADMACGGFSVKMIQTLSKAAGLPNGKSYAGLQDWLNDLNGRLIRMEVKRHIWEGKEKVDFGFPQATQYPTCNHVMRSNNAAAQVNSPNIPAGFTQVSNEEVPF